MGTFEFWLGLGVFLWIGLDHLFSSVNAWLE